MTRNSTARVFGMHVESAERKLAKLRNQKAKLDKTRSTSEAWRSTLRFIEDESVLLENDLKKLAHDAEIDPELAKAESFPDRMAGILESARELRENCNVVALKMHRFVFCPRTRAEAADYVAHLADASNPNPWPHLTREQGCARIAELLKFPELEV